MKKYIHLFESTHDADNAWANDYSTPWVSVVKGASDSVKFNDNNYILINDEEIVSYGSKFSAINNPRILFEEGCYYECFIGHIVDTIYDSTYNTLVIRSDIPAKGSSLQSVNINLNTNTCSGDMYFPD